MREEDRTSRLLGGGDQGRTARNVEPFQGQRKRLQVELRPKLTEMREGRRVAPWTVLAAEYSASRDTREGVQRMRRYGEAERQRSTDQGKRGHGARDEQPTGQRPKLHGRPSRVGRQDARGARICRDPPGKRLLDLFLSSCSSSVWKKTSSGPVSEAATGREDSSATDRYWLAGRSPSVHTAC